MEHSHGCCCAPPKEPARGDACCAGGDVREVVKEYYGKTLRSTSDLQTCACTTQSRPPPHIAAVLPLLHDEVASRYYGCGLTIPTTVAGLAVVDLGCGSGRDCYLLSKLVGPSGSVHGVDMTDEQLEVARRHVDFHTKQFGYDKPNVFFHKGFIEKLSMIPDNSVDLIVSNCVLNLSADKQSVLNEAYRVLRRGGELYFSDVYSDRRVPPEVSADPVLIGECIGGALYWKDFVVHAHRAGFSDPRLVEDRPMTAEGPLAEKLRGISFASATYRLWKLDGLDADWEDYGQEVVYKGTIAEQPGEFRLDRHNVFIAGQKRAVCRNTWLMLHETRLSSHFDFVSAGAQAAAAAAPRVSSGEQSEEEEEEKEEEDKDEDEEVLADEYKSTSHASESDEEQRRALQEKQQISALMKMSRDLLAIFTAKPSEERTHQPCTFGEVRTGFKAMQMLLASTLSDLIVRPTVSQIEQWTKVNYHPLFMEHPEWRVEMAMMEACTTASS
eukprot:m51a1_g14280 putative methyltransferase type 11 (498) ;mRNA; f:361833-371729